MMKVKRKDRGIMFKDVPCGAAFATENDIYMKCYDIVKEKGTCEYFAVTIGTGRMVLVPDDRDVTLLDMEVTEV